MTTISVTVTKVGNTTFTKTEITDISGVIHKPVREETITKSSTITDVVTESIKVEPITPNINKTTHLRLRYNSGFIGYVS